MENIDKDDILKAIYDQIFPLSEGTDTRHFDSEALMKNMSFLLVWPAVLTIKLCEKTNEKRLAEELLLLKKLEIIIKHTEVSPSKEAAISSAPAWIKNKEMVAIIKIIHSKKNFLWKILTTLYKKEDQSHEEFDELICKYCFLLFALLYHNETKEKKILLFEDDMVEYLLQVNNNKPARYHLSCMCLYYIFNSAFNSYEVVKKIDDDKNTNWSIEHSCNPDCMEELTKGESEENISEERYCLDGSNVKTDDIGRIICCEIFKTADKILGLYYQLIENIDKLPLDLPRLFAKSPVLYKNLFSAIKNSSEFSSILYHYKDLLKYAQTIQSELNKEHKDYNLEKSLENINIIIKKEQKNEELYPEIEEALLEAVDEVWRLKARLNDDEYKDPYKSMEYFNNKLDNREFPLLKKIAPVKIFFIKISDYKKEDAERENKEKKTIHNLLFYSENWERDVCERILPIIKLDLEDKPWGVPAEGRALWSKIKPKYRAKVNS